jgi:hypothetical protein
VFNKNELPEGQPWSDIAFGLISVLLILFALVFLQVLVKPNPNHMNGDRLDDTARFYTLSITHHHKPTIPKNPTEHIVGGRMPVLCASSSNKWWFHRRTRSEFNIFWHYSMWFMLIVQWGQHLRRMGERRNQVTEGDISKWHFLT